MAETASTKITVSGSYTTKVPAERCVVSLQVNKEGRVQSDLLAPVTDVSNQISEHLRTELCSKDAHDAVSVNSAVTHWSMQTLSTRSWRPYNQETNREEEYRMYGLSTSFRIHFRDFEALAKCCLEWSKEDMVSINGLEWKLTKATETSLQRDVRRGAVQDAITKATDYASVLHSDPTLKCVDINAGGGHYGQPMMASMRIGGGDGGEVLKFEPEDVGVTAEVECIFLLHSS